MSNNINETIHDLKNAGGRLPMIIKSLDRAIDSDDIENVERHLKNLSEGIEKLKKISGDLGEKLKINAGGQ